LAKSHNAADVRPARLLSWQENLAALPVTRTIKNPSSFIFRIEPLPAKLLERAKKEPRIDTDNGAPSAKWLSFMLNSEADFRDALWWLNQAYEHAK
jgi:hypothetical protein